MTQKVLKKENLKKLLQAINKENKVFGPVADGKSAILSELTENSEITFDFFNYKLPVKRQFFPFSEIVGTYSDQELQTPDLNQEKIILFGIRPCDAKAFVYLDKIFIDEVYVDPYYKEKRDNTLVISMACSSPLKTCFCTSINGSPDSKEGSDLIFYVLEKNLLFESCSEKGESFLKQFSSIMEDAKAELAKEKDAQTAKANQILNKIELSSITKDLDAKFQDKAWITASESCLSCGACTYLCPTCHCFGIYDEKRKQTGLRVKVHDTCQFPAFTMEVSGHNPRHSSRERMRQRIMHKFSYTVKKNDSVFCVGCGRCTNSCPVNIDIKETLLEVTK